MQVNPFLRRGPEPFDQTTKRQGFLGDDQGANGLRIVQHLNAEGELRRSRALAHR
jgi:hypothetical protein